jgi:hypothetical protein
MKKCWMVEEKMCCKEWEPVIVCATREFARDASRLMTRIDFSGVSSTKYRVSRYARIER